MSEPKAAEKVAEKVWQHRDLLLVTLGVIGVVVLVWWLLRNYRLGKKETK